MNALTMLNNHLYLLNALGGYADGEEYLKSLMNQWAAEDNQEIPEGSLSTKQPANLGGYFVSSQEVFGANAPSTQWLAYLITQYTQGYIITLSENTVARGLAMYNLGHPFTDLIPEEGHRV